MRLFFALCAVVASATSVQATGFPHVTVYGKDGVIVPKEYLERSKLPFEGFWTPAKEQLEELEQSLPKFLEIEVKSHSSSDDFAELLWKAPRSRRQYIGIIMDGRLMIWVNCFPERPLTDEDPFANWDCAIIVVQDGGSDFWGVIYDIEKHSFNKLMVNGSA